LSEFRILLLERSSKLRWIYLRLSGKCAAGGLLFRSGQSNLQYVTTAAFLATVYGNYLSNSRSTMSCGGAIVTPLQLASFAKGQVYWS